MKPKYKVGQTVKELSSSNVTLQIIEILPNTVDYRYAVFRDGIYAHTRTFNIKRFEEKTRPMTKLDQVLK